METPPRKNNWSRNELSSCYKNGRGGLETISKAKKHPKPLLSKMTQRPIATISIPEGTDTAKLEIMREMIPGGDLHNRYIRDSESKVQTLKPPF